MNITHHANWDFSSHILNLELKSLFKMTQENCINVSLLLTALSVKKKNDKQACSWKFPNNFQADWKPKYLTSVKKKTKNYIGWISNCKPGYNSDFTSKYFHLFSFMKILLWRIKFMENCRSVSDYIIFLRLYVCSCICVTNWGGVGSEKN